MGRKLSYGMAINEALHQMMGADERVFILGEDVAKMGGDFGITKGIWEKWPNRIKDTALSESAILGLSCGAVRVKASTGNHVCRLFRGLL